MLVRKIKGQEYQKDSGFNIGRIRKKYYINFIYYNRHFLMSEFLNKYVNFIKMTISANYT